MEEPSIHEQSAAYALHALPENETLAFEEHLSACTVCMAELDSLRTAAAALAYASDRPTPSADLRRRILERVRTDPTRSPVLLLRRRLALPAAAAVAATVAIVLGVWASLLHDSLARERARRAADSRAVAVLSSPGARRYPLIGARGSLAVAPGGEAALVVSLRPAPGGKSYEAWVVAGGEPQPAGVFSGGGRTTLALTRRVPRGARVAVSLERAGGVLTLTGTLLFGAQTA